VIFSSIQLQTLKIIIVFFLPSLYKKTTQAKNQQQTEHQKTNASLNKGFYCDW